MFMYVKGLHLNRYPIRFYAGKKDFYHMYENDRIYVSNLEIKYRFRNFGKI